MMKLSTFNLIIPTETEGEYLLTNTMSGAVVGIDEELKSLLEKRDITALDLETVKTFSELGIVIPDDLDEYQKFKVLYESTKYATDSLYFTVITTYACNLACPYCYEGKGELLHGTMNRNTRERAVTFMKKKIQKTGAKKISLVLYGGEPLLNFDDSVSIMDSLFMWAEEQGITCESVVLTNGTLMTPAIAAALHLYKTRAVQVTFDGPKRLHDKKRVYKNGKGTFDDIIEAIYTLRDHHVPVGIRINIDIENRPYLSELLDELEALNLKDIPVACGIVTESMACQTYPSCIQEEDTRKTLDDFRKIVEKKGYTTPVERVHAPKFITCKSLGEKAYILDPYADIYKCLTFVGLKEHSIGHITDTGDIEYTWAYYDWMSRDPLTIKECQKCVMLPSCGGGCAAISYERYKTYHTCGCSDPLSEMKDQLKWFITQRFPGDFKDGKIIWD